MTNRPLVRVATALLAAAALAAPATTLPATAAEKEAAAAEVPEDVDSNALKRAFSSFESGFASVDIDFKLRALRRFARVQHPKVAKQLLKIVKDDESEHVRATALKGLVNQRTSVKTVGSKLTKLVQEKDEAPRVLVAAIGTLGEIGWTKAHKNLVKLMQHDDDDVVVAVFGTYGKWKSDEPLDDMRKFFHKWPDEKGFVTVSVNVDTGTAGSADQKAAEAKGRSALGKHKAWRPRPECSAALKEALKEITGFGFRRPDDLDRYLENPKKYVDPETIAERKDEPARKHVYRDWLRIKKAATDHAAEKVKGEDANARDKRAKAYGRKLYDLRRDLLEKHDLLLSELDVIVEEGEEAKWPAAE